MRRTMLGIIAKTPKPRANSLPQNGCPWPGGVIWHRLTP